MAQLFKSLGCSRDTTYTWLCMLTTDKGYLCPSITKSSEKDFILTPSLTSTIFHFNIWLGGGVRHSLTPTGSDPFGHTGEVFVLPGATCKGLQADGNRFPWDPALCLGPPVTRGIQPHGIPVSGSPGGSWSWDLMSIVPRNPGRGSCKSCSWLATPTLVTDIIRPAPQKPFSWLIRLRFPKT